MLTHDHSQTGTKKKKFLSAKLLTFFNEHPLIFIGYSASDANIRAILSDIDEALPEKGGIIPNVYILEWNKEIGEDTNPSREKLIATEDGRSIRVKFIEADDFSWVFNAFAANPVLNDVNPRVLRALVARSYELYQRPLSMTGRASKVEALPQTLPKASLWNPVLKSRVSKGPCPLAGLGGAQPCLLDRSVSEAVGISTV